MQLLSLPATGCGPGHCFARFPLSTPLPLCSLIEELQALLYRTLLHSEVIFSCGNHADRFPGSNPLQLVSRPNPVLVGDGFGYSQLQLACDLRHILTIARILSLLTSLQTCAEEARSLSSGQACHGL